MKSVLISIQPKWCEKIAKGEKTIEVRKTRPKIETPFKCYIYCTKTKNKWSLCDYEGAYQNNKGEIVYAQQRIIGEFVCDRIEEFHEYELSPSKKFYEFEKARLDLFLKESCLSYNEVCEYRKNLPYYKPLYGWHISNLVIYDKPKELNEFWVYNEELHKRYKSEEDYCAWGNSTTESGCPTNDCEGTDLLQCYQCWEYWSGWCHKLKRPPQSWCYVEELEEKQK